MLPFLQRKKLMPLLKVAQLRAEAARSKAESLKANSFGGLLKNTITGIPQAAKNYGKGLLNANIGQAFGNESLNNTIPGITANTILGTPKAAKEALFPTRGYSEKQLADAKPNFWQAAQGIPKVAAEMSTGLGQFPSMIPGFDQQAQKITNTRIGSRLADAGAKIADYGTPKNVEEAKAMRFGDVAGFLPIGSAKRVGTAATEASKLLPAPKAPLLAPANQVPPPASTFAKGPTNDVVKKALDANKQRLVEEGYVKPTSVSESPRTVQTSPLLSATQGVPLLGRPKPQGPELLPPTSGGFQKPPSKTSSSVESTGDFNPDKYIKEQVRKQEAARTGKTGGILTKTKSFLADAKRKLVDFSAPIEDVLYDSLRKNNIKLKPSEDIHNQIDRALRAPTIAGQFARDNGIVKIIQKIDDADTFDQYLIAKHAIELDTRGITTGRSLASDQQLVAAFKGKYTKEEKVVSDYSRKLLDYSVETGLVSKELAATLKARYPEYVPFNRIFSEDEIQKGVGSSGMASLSKQTAVQKIEGSMREVESPLRSLLAKTNDVFRQGEKNKAAQLLAGYEKLPGNPFQLKEIKGFVDDATGKKLTTFDDKAKDTISFFENGEKRVFKTTPEIAQAAKSLNVQQLNILGQIFAFPVRVARLGMTGINAPFILTNLVRDQTSAFINSSKALSTSIANPKNFVKALFSALKHDELYDEMVRAGGGGTSYDISRNQVEYTFDSIRAGKNLPSRILHTARNPGELLRAVENIVGRAEELTRIQQYRGTKQALMKDGMSESEAVIGGARASRENTVNFSRRGEWGVVLNSALLYLNSSIQGTRVFLRNVRNRPAATAVKVATSAFMPMAVITAWNMNDPKRKEAYDDIQEYEKVGNFIIVPDNPTKNAEGKWNVIKIPLSQEINELTGLVRRPIEQAYGLDPVRFGDIYKALMGTVSPIGSEPRQMLGAFIPQAVKPSIESLTNKSLFTGNSIVPQGMEKLDPEYQVKPYTSGTARKIGGILNVSPIKTEAFIKSTFGGVGSQALNASDTALAGMGVIPKEQIGGQSIPEGILSRFGKATGGKNKSEGYDMLDKAAREKSQYKTDNIRPIYDEVQALKDSGDTAAAQARVDALSDSDYELYKDIRTAEKSKATKELQIELIPTYEQVQQLKAEGSIQEAQAIVDALSDDEYHAYTLLKEKLQ